MDEERKLLRLFASGKLDRLEDVSELLPHLEYIRTNDAVLWSKFITLLQELKLHLLEKDFEKRQTTLDF